MTRELILFSRNIISFVKLYFVYDDMHKVVHFEEGARPHLNRKTIFANIGIFPCKDKMVSISFYFYHGNSYTFKTTPSLWDSFYLVDWSWAIWQANEFDVIFPSWKSMYDKNPAFVLLVSINSTQSNATCACIKVRVPSLLKNNKLLPQNHSLYQGSHSFPWIKTKDFSQRPFQDQTKCF